MILFFYQLCLFLIDLLQFIVKAAVSIVQSIIFLPFSSALKNVQGNVVLITGGGHGLGRELALYFSKRGAKIVVWDINEELNQQTANDVNKEGGTAYAYTCDVSNYEEVTKTAKQVLSEVGPVSILVNNAGILHCRPLLMLNHQQIERTLKVNTLAHFWTIREFLPSMLDERKGHIVCVSSLAGRAGFANLTDYSASKFAVVGLMTSLAEEMRFYKHNFINFTTIHPVIINTGMAQKPRVKHPWLCPIIEPDEAARVIGDAVLRNEKLVYVPRPILYVWRLIGALPLKVQDQFMEFLGSGLDMHT